MIPKRKIYICTTWTVPFLNTPKAPNPQSVPGWPPIGRVRTSGHTPASPPSLDSGGNKRSDHKQDNIGIEPPTDSPPLPLTLYICVCGLCCEFVAYHQISTAAAKCNFDEPFLTQVTSIVHHGERGRRGKRTEVTMTLIGILEQQVVR